jgi:SAM-dependent methyltransferase
MPGEATSDDIYYQGAGRIAWQRRLARSARTSIYRAFLSEMRPTATTTILDIGASDIETREANILEKNYPYPRNITCGIIGESANLRAAHPEVKIVQLAPGKPLPFPDQSFDVAYSNAVLEHVGGPEQRRFFIAEALRVARAVFIAVPNRWFPFEHHTGVPLLHYAPKLFRRALKGTPYDHWSRVENLDFVSAAMLAREWPEGSHSKIGHNGLRLGILSSNVIATTHR